MNEFSIEALRIIIEILRGSIPKELDVEKTEEDIITALTYALQTFEIDSKEFETFAAIIGLDDYCKLQTLQLLSKLKNLMASRENVEEIKDTIEQLTTHEIPGICFKKYVYMTVTNAILRLKLLYNYVDFVEAALALMKDKEIKSIAIF